VPLPFKTLARLSVVLPLTVVVVGAIALADGDDGHFRPGNLVVSLSRYDDRAANIAVGTQIPPFCVTGCVVAGFDGTYPTVFNNNPIDGSFGVTSRIFLDQMTPEGRFIDRLEVPNSLTVGDRDGDADDQNRDQMVTSFSSKSELALNLSTDRKVITFMGYLAPVNAIDVSNSNTPLDPDPTNPVNEAFYRVVASVDRFGRFHFTKTNAYSGNNGRAAILNSADQVIYTAGNAGNGGNPQPDGIIIGGGAQILDPSNQREADQNPGQPTPVGSFNITQLPANAKTDKIGKDTNFRGLTIFNNVVYFTKGSGGNGIDTVYFIDTTGGACPNGVGVPAPGAKLPTEPLPTNTTTLQTKGVTPYNMCILSGLPTVLAKNAVDLPFGIWFANATTLYVADEGAGTVGTGAGFYTPATESTTAGLQKWTFNGTTWSLAYVIQAGLDLGVPYTVPGYPTGTNAGNGNLPWAPATDGLRNLTGRVNDDGTVTIWAITSTVSGSGDQGADPNRLVRVTDKLSAKSAGTESFSVVRTARTKEVLPGVSFTPGGDEDRDRDKDRDRDGKGDKDGGRKDGGRQ
jgi:hypothetical protein